MLQTKNTALCPTLLHLDIASSQLGGIIGTKSVESNSSQQSLVPEGSFGSLEGFSGTKSDDGGNSRGSTEWGRGLGGRGGRVDAGTRRGGDGGQGGRGQGGGGGGGGGEQAAVTVGRRAVGGQADRGNQGAGGKVLQSGLGGGGLGPTQSTKSTWRFSRTTSGPSTTTLDPLRADLDSVLSAVIRSSVECLTVKYFSVKCLTDKCLTDKYFRSKILRIKCLRVTCFWTPSFGVIFCWS